MYEYKTTVAPVWGWWGSGHNYPEDRASDGQERLRRAIDRHVQREGSENWELVSLKHFDQASDHCIICVWKRPRH